MKTYGKEPESLESIISLFSEALADFPAAKIQKALTIHAQRNQEFPTPADIVSLIRRNGKPPLRESDIIAIRKKDGQDRSTDEWAMLKEWDTEQREGWKEFSDPAKDKATLDENIRLRQKVALLEQEIKRLTEMLREDRTAKGLQKPELSLQEKILNTVNAMRTGGAAQADIDAFLKEFGSRG